MPRLEYAAYEAAEPYFDLVRGALGELVDGEHFFDAVADDVVYEVLYDFPGWPRIVEGRADLMNRFRAMSRTSRFNPLTSSSRTGQGTAGSSSSNTKSMGRSSRPA